MLFYAILITVCLVLLSVCLGIAVSIISYVCQLKDFEELRKQNCFLESTIEDLKQEVNLYKNKYFSYREAALFNSDIKAGEVKDD